MAKRRPGRPDALTPEAHTRIIEAVRAGATQKDAAAHAGIVPSTLYHWVERGGTPGQPAKYKEFSDALTRANADAKVSAIAFIRRAMPEDWRAALAYLERRYPQEWGKRTTVTGADGGPVQVESHDQVDAELEQLLSEEAAKRNGSANGTH